MGAVYWSLVDRCQAHDAKGSCASVLSWGHGHSEHHKTDHQQTPCLCPLIYMPHEKKKAPNGEKESTS